MPAGEIERFVVEEIKPIRRDSALVAATVAESRRLVQAGIKRLKAERAALERQRRADEAELGRLGAAGDRNGDVALAQERVGSAQRRLSEIQDELARLLAADISEKDVAVGLGEFDALWAALTPKERARALALLISRVDHDGRAGTVEITFQPTGVKTLAAQVRNHEETAA